MYQISKWINGILYLEYGNTIQEHTLYMGSTNSISARQLKNLTLLSYPQDSQEIKTTTFSMNLSFGNEDCFGFVYHDQESYKPISCGSSTSLSTNENLETNPRNKNKSKNKNKNKTRNDWEKEKIQTIQPFLLFSSETESESSFASFVDSSEEASLIKQETTHKSYNLFSESHYNSKEFSQTVPNTEKQKTGTKTETVTKQKQTQKQNQKEEYSGRSLIVLSPHGCYSIFREFLVEIAEDVFNDPSRINYWSNFISTRWPKQIQLGKVCHDFKLTDTVSLSVFIPGKPETIFDHYDEICWSKGYYGLGIDLYSFFSSNLEKLWQIWQIILMGQPLVVFAPNTKTCSSITLVLSSLIYPFKYDGEIIPYLTRNDSNYKKILKFNSEKSYYFNSKKNSQFSSNSFIIGTTDLSLKKTLFSDWDNFLYIGLDQENDFHLKINNRNIKIHLTNQTFQKLIMKSESLIIPDKKLLKKLKKKNKQINIKKDSRYKTNLIRQHFFTITSQFLTTFELYFNTLIPELQEIKPFFTGVLIKGFSEKKFIKKLKAYQLGKHFNRKLITNYEYLFRKFIHTSTFMRWYHDQQQKSGLLYYKLYRQTILQIKLTEVLPKETEIEIIDLFFRMSKELSTAIQLHDHRLFNKSIELMQQAIGLLPNELQLNLKGKIEQANRKMKKRQKKLMKKRKNSFYFSNSYSSNSENSENDSFDSSSISNNSSSSSSLSTLLKLPISNSLNFKNELLTDQNKQPKKIENEENN
ncbi:hypothetical protein M0813_18235 [Anaeramoeba flamelloides]|uniref:UDENN domain-containing protein n=1 Tax=Anaeramoeba flamelloides TaxID=1746091 RepID=A0ABQ8YSS9_9EUKA|nr:hypothetical protein M0813_18235 [Anaeramoeba flamelloides]